MTTHPSILAHGIDLVEVARIAKMLADHPERFRDRVFTPAEIAYCESSRKRAAEHFAARFAAKEAVLKALGTGWRDGIAWTDIEIRRDPAGVPSVHLTGEAAAVGSSLGITRWLISLSHTSTLAQASALGLGEVR
jgi:holo-[acyl-carrier protein] synthase